MLFSTRTPRNELFIFNERKNNNFIYLFILKYTKKSAYSTGRNRKYPSIY